MEHRLGSRRSRKSRKCPIDWHSNLLSKSGNEPFANCKLVGENSWLPSLQLQHESSSVLLAGMENGCGGRSLPLSFRMESTTDGSRIPRLAEFARIKTNSSGLITPKAGWSTRVREALTRIGCGVRFELTTFRLRDLTQLSLRVGLYVHPAERDARHAVSMPPSFFPRLGSVLP